jgi:electron transfer flavoprotein alpha subunit
MAGIFVFAEARDGELRKVALEAVSAGRRLADQMGTEVHAVLVGGPGTRGGAGELARYGADRIFVAEADAFARYSPEGFAAVAVDFIREHECDAAVFPGSSMGKDLAPRVAARLGVGYAADVVELGGEGGALEVTRPRYAGKVFSRVGFSGKPAVLTIRPNVFAPTERPAAGEVSELRPPASTDFRVVVREILASAGEKLDVSEALIVVAGGRGLREPANFRLLEDLADALGGAAVGASRAVVDAGWRPHAEQVGQTGKTVSPTLYFAVGISGAIQHLAGMRTSKFIVAINKDPDAPIFKVADYGIVGDLFEILPRLTEEVRKLRG